MAVKIETSVVINRPVEEVFAFLDDPEKDVLWQSGVLLSRTTSTGPMGVGTTMESEATIMGRRVKSTFLVTEYEPIKKIAYQTTSGPLPMEGGYRFDSLAGGNTKVTFIAEGDASGFFKLAETLIERMAQRQWETNLATLKDTLEAQAA